MTLSRGENLAGPIGIIGSRPKINPEDKNLLNFAQLSHGLNSCFFPKGALANWCESEHAIFLWEIE